MPAKPNLVVYAKSLTGHWKKVGVGWKRQTKDVSNATGKRADYIKVQLDFMPPGGELTIWKAIDRPDDVDQEEEEEPPFDTRHDLMPTIVEEAG